jgi:GAF domain-containing protein
MTARPGVTELLKQLIQIGIALTSERELSTLLERIVAEARRFTNAEAGTLFLRSGDELRFAVAQNDALAQRMGEKEMRRYFASQPLCLTEPSLAGYVTLTGQSISLPDAYEVSATQPYVFNRSIDAHLQYQTGSVLVVPLQEPSGEVIGVLQLINARDEAGALVPFSAGAENAIGRLLVGWAQRLGSDHP